MKELTLELLENIRTNPKEQDWSSLSRNYNLPPEFITKHKDLVYWDWVSTSQKLSPEIITKHKDLVDWFNISIYQKLTPEFITENKDYNSNNENSFGLSAWTKEKANVKIIIPIEWLVLMI